MIFSLLVGLAEAKDCTIRDAQQVILDHIDEYLREEAKSVTNILVYSLISEDRNLDTNHFVATMNVEQKFNPVKQKLLIDYSFSTNDCQIIREEYQYLSVKK